MASNEFKFNMLFKSKTTPIKQSLLAVKQLRLGVLGTVAAIVGLGFGFSKLMSHSMTLSASIGRFIAMTGLSSQKLQTWQQIAKQTGVSSDTVKSSLIGLQNAQTALIKGQGSANAWNILGIMGLRGEKDPTKLLEKLRTTLPKLVKENGYGMTRQWLSEVGVSEDMMKVLLLKQSKFNQYKKTHKFSIPKNGKILIKLEPECGSIKNTI